MSLRENHLEMLSVVRIFGFNDATEEADGWSQQPDVTHNA
jgi:hypothetical protein